MRTTSRRITLPEKMLWLTGLGAAVSLYDPISSYYHPSCDLQALIIPAEMFNLSGHEETQRTVYYDVDEDTTTIFYYKDSTLRQQVGVSSGRENLVKLLDFK